MTEQLGPWLRRLGPAGGDAVRLFCFPHAGGTASSYLRLATHLAPEVEVLAVQYPGRQDRFGERCLESLTELADAAFAGIRPHVQPGRPLALFGHSMGATVAFEVARRLEAQGTQPLALIASGRTAPSCPPLLGGRVLDEAAVLADIQRLGGTDTRVLDDLRLRAVVMPPLYADYVAVQTYRFGADGNELPVRCRVTALRGDRDPRVPAADSAAWARHTTGTFDRQEFPGGHFYLDENAAEVAALVTSLLASEVRA